MQLVPAFKVQFPAARSCLQMLLPFWSCASGQVQDVSNFISSCFTLALQFYQMGSTYSCPASMFQICIVMVPTPECPGICLLSIFCWVVSVFCLGFGQLLRIVEILQVLASVVCRRIFRRFPCLPWSFVGALNLDSLFLVEFTGFP